MRDHNTIISKLGQRVREIDQLISELRILVQNNLSTPQNQCEIDMDKLTIMGHGFGATTAVVTASKDNRVRFVVSFDPWLSPLKDEILSKSILVKQPHCSINSEMFHANVEGNWELINMLFREAKARMNRNPDDGNLLCLLNDVGHSAFSDLSLLLLLELRLINFTPSLGQVFRGQYNIKLVIDLTRAFFMRNKLDCETGKYDDVISRLEKTKDVHFEVK